MKKITRKLMSLFLVFSFMITAAMPVAAAEGSGVRSNLVFQEGKAGDTHLVYTYDQDGNSFKVEEDFSEGLTNGNSTIYIKDLDGNYVLFSTQEVSTESNGDLVVTIVDNKKSIEKYVISADEIFNSETDNIVTYASSWTTQTKSGSTNIRNFTISAIIASVGALATYYCGSAGGQAAIAGLTSLATSLYNYNATTAYYYKVYKWRDSPRNWLVVDEIEDTDWYSDSAHRNYMGNTYYEWIY